MASMVTAWLAAAAVGLWYGRGDLVEAFTVGWLIGAYAQWRADHASAGRESVRSGTRA